MPDETKRNLVAHRRTGGAAMFLNKAKLAAQKTIAEANSKKAADLAAAHDRAHAIHAAARTRGLGVGLEKIFKLDGDPDSSMYTTEFAPDGSITQPRTRLTSISGAYNKFVYDAAAKRVYFATGSRIFAPGIGTVKEFPHGLVGTLAFDAQNRKLYSPNQAAGIYVFDIADSSYSEIGPIPNVSNATFGSAIALDPLHKRIYCWNSPFDWEQTTNSFTIISYDGSDVRTVSVDLGSQANHVSSIDIDPVREFVYGRSVSALWRAPLDLSQIAIIRSLKEQPFLHNIDSMVVDRTSHLLYWSECFTQPAASQSRSILYRSTTDGELEPQEMFDLQRTYGQVVWTISLITQAGEASEILVKAHSEKTAAPKLALRKVAQATKQAHEDRQAAHAKLEKANADADKKIADKNEEAADTRRKAQDNARARESEGSQLVSKAKSAADKKQQDANDRAQKHLAACQKQADDITGPAKANLDAKRQELQNS